MCILLYCAIRAQYVSRFFAIFSLMLRRPPRATLTDPRFPYTTLFRSVRQAQLIDFARPRPQKENIPAVENDMRNQVAAIAPEEMNRDPARLRLGRTIGRAHV